MILKSYIVEQNLDILKDYQATLIYGENNGIKNDIKEKIKNQKKDSEIINFFENDVIASDFLYENIVNESLFIKKKIIFIHESSDKIFDKILECLEKENNNIEIYILSENLDKKSKLRNWFEKTKKLAILPCYKDNEKTLSVYINKQLRDYTGLTGEVISLIINNSNMDRMIIKDELLKIQGFFKEKKINKEQVIEILNIKNNGAFEDIRDKALSGEKRRINQLLSETEILSEEVYFYLNNLNYRIMRLHEIIEKSEGNKNNYEQILENLKPPIFWKDKSIIIQQLEKWTQKKLEEMITKIGKTEILMKKSSYLKNEVIIKDLVISLTNKASTIS